MGMEEGRRISFPTSLFPPYYLSPPNMMPFVK